MINETMIPKNENKRLHYENDRMSYVIWLFQEALEEMFHNGEIDKLIASKETPRKEKKFLKQMKAEYEEGIFRSVPIWAYLPALDSHTLFKDIITHMITFCRVSYDLAVEKPVIQKSVRKDAEKE